MSKISYKIILYLLNDQKYQKMYKLLIIIESSVHRLLHFHLILIIDVYSSDCSAYLIGLAIHLKYVKPSQTAKQVPIDEKYSRGGPKLATCTLLVD